MEDTDVVLLLKYPLIVKILEGDVEVYKGSIFINDEDHEIRITKLDDGNFKLSLPEKLTGFEAELEDTIAKLHPKNIITVLDTICASVNAREPSVKLIDRSDTYRHILHEYSDFTKFYLNLKSCQLSHDLTKISVSMLDERGREHRCEISVNFDDKHLFNMTSYDLPADKEITIKSSTLKDVYEEFLGMIEAFQAFFDVTNEFDRNCWILDPEEPTKSCTYRRIWIRENLSVIVTLNPTDVFRLPEIQFLGPERLVEEYRDTLNTNIEGWEPEKGVFSEILKLLGLENFPQRPTIDEHAPDLLVNSGDCSICFSARLNDQLPDVVCKNKFCENRYHAECLYEWLMSVNARRCFSEVVGLCPNCEKNITCPIPK